VLGSILLGGSDVCPVSPVGAGPCPGTLLTVFGRLRGGPVRSVGAGPCPGVGLLKSGWLRRGLGSVIFGVAVSRRAFFCAGGRGVLCVPC